jgi:hypothetical protein
MGLKGVKNSGDLIECHIAVELLENDPIAIQPLDPEAHHPRSMSVSGPAPNHQYATVLPVVSVKETPGQRERRQGSTVTDPTAINPSASGAPSAD